MQVNKMAEPAIKSGLNVNGKKNNPTLQSDPRGYNATGFAYLDLGIY